MAAYYEEARRMYVQEGKTIFEIAQVLKDVSERTFNAGRLREDGRKNAENTL